MDLGSGSWGYRSKDASCKHLRVLLCALVVIVNIYLDVRGKFFDRELSIFTEQVLGLKAHLDFSDRSGAGSPSVFFAPLGETCRGIEDFYGAVVKLFE